ncbi:hypothetical protein [Thermoproteus tenax]|uniref:hypothetical protein n=1 Tax=Thermoproteus tenax TaxID=2271 RepID=UPI001432E260|nr:hypothetical protein [Thermoproteus tenax]
MSARSGGFGGSEALLVELGRYPPFVCLHCDAFVLRLVLERSSSVSLSTFPESDSVGRRFVGLGGVAHPSPPANTSIPLTFQPSSFRPIGMYVSTEFVLVEP